MEFIWVPGYQGDESAESVSSLVENIACIDVLILSVLVANKMDEWELGPIKLMKLQS